MSTDLESNPYPDSPFPRGNFFGDDDDQNTPGGGHRETRGTDPAEYIAFQELLPFVQPICGHTLEAADKEIELSDPMFYLPKQHDRGSRNMEYRQHRHRRRVNEENGKINWGETTWTELPEVDFETYWQAVHNYLARRQVRITNVETYLTRAKRFWHDQELNSHEAMKQFVRFVRDEESPADQE